VQNSGWRDALISASDLRASRSTPGTTACCAAGHPGPSKLQARRTIVYSTFAPTMWRAS